MEEELLDAAQLEAIIAAAAGDDDAGGGGGGGDAAYYDDADADVDAAMELDLGEGSPLGSPLDGPDAAASAIKPMLTEGASLFVCSAAT